MLDNDGINLDTPIPIRLKITVSGDTVDFDVTGSADQTMGPVNCGAAQAVSACGSATSSCQPGSNPNGRYLGR